MNYSYLLTQLFQNLKMPAHRYGPIGKIRLEFMVYIASINDTNESILEQEWYFNFPFSDSIDDQIMMETLRSHEKKLVRILLT